MGALIMTRAPPPLRGVLGVAVGAASPVRAGRRPGAAAPAAGSAVRGTRPTDSIARLLIVLVG